MCPALAKVTWYDDIDGVTRTSVHVMQAFNFTDAAKQLEDHYGDNLVEMRIKLYEDGLIEFPVEMYDRLDQWLKGEIH